MHCLDVQDTNTRRVPVGMLLAMDTVYGHNKERCERKATMTQGEECTNVCKEKRL